MSTVVGKSQTVASFHGARTGDSTGMTFSPYYAILEEAASAWREEIATLEQRQADRAAQENSEPRETDTWTLTLRSRAWGTGLTWREIAPITQVLASMGHAQFILTKGEISR